MSNESQEHPNKYNNGQNAEYTTKKEKFDEKLIRRILNPLDYKNFAEIDREVEGFPYRPTHFMKRSKLSGNRFFKVVV